MLEGLSLLWKRFSPLEERLLAEARTALPQGARNAFDAQVVAINKVQRSPPSWNEICFYRMARGRPDWAGVPLFPRTDEFRLLEVRFSVGRSYRATLTCIGGHIFDFATVPGPKTKAFAAWDAPATVVLLADPLCAAAASKEPETLPPIWQQVLARHPRHLPSGWIVHDETTAYRLAMGEAEYLILGERAGEEFILHRIEPESAGLFYQESHDGVAEPFEGDVDALIAGRPAKK